MNDNPYSAPVLGAELDETAPVEESFGTIAKQVFLAWEKLRGIYVSLLALETMLVAGRFLGQMEVLVTVIGGAMAANLLYLAGPAVETYIRWLGYRADWPRWVMFVGGTLFAMLLALFTLSFGLLPNPN